MKTKLVLFAFLALTFLLLSGCDLDLTNRPTETPEPSLTPNPTETPTPTATATSEPTATPEPAWLMTIKIQDPEGQSFKIENGQPVINLYDTKDQQESIGLNLESIKITATTDGLNPNILTAKDADGNQYTFNPDYGWFKIPEVQMDYANLSKYTEVDQAFMEDGRHNIVRAFNYANSPDKISSDAHSVFWITAKGDNLLCLSFFPVGQTGVAQRLWPTEYSNTFYSSEDKPFVFSGFYKVNLKGGGYIYVIDRTIKIDDSHTSGLSNGFDKAAYEYLAVEDAGPGRSPLVRSFEHVNQGRSDFVTILSPPDRLADGTPISFDPNTAALDKRPNPVVASLQGSRGDLIKSFGIEDQRRIILVLSENIRPDIPNNGKINTTTAPLADPSLLAGLSNHILLTSIGSP